MKMPKNKIIFVRRENKFRAADRYGKLRYRLHKKECRSFIEA